MCVCVCWKQRDRSEERFERDGVTGGFFGFGPRLRGPVYGAVVHLSLGCLDTCIAGSCLKSYKVTKKEESREIIYMCINLLCPGRDNISLICRILQKYPHPVNLFTFC